MKAGLTFAGIDCTVVFCEVGSKVELWIELF